MRSGAAERCPLLLFPQALPEMARPLLFWMYQQKFGAREELVHCSQLLFGTYQVIDPGLCLVEIGQIYSLIDATNSLVQISLSLGLVPYGTRPYSCIFYPHFNSV